jgi:hypothetical protein
MLTRFVQTNTEGLGMPRARPMAHREKFIYSFAKLGNAALHNGSIDPTR